MNVPSRFPRGTAVSESSTDNGTVFPSDTPAYDDQLLRRLLRRHLGTRTPAWFSPLSFRLETGKAHVLTVSMPHELFFRWYAIQGRSALEKAVHTVLGNGITLCYVWPDGSPAAVPPVSSSFQEKVHDTYPGFDEFLLNGRNRETVQLFRNALHLSPSTILLRGSSGTGKTHLARAAFRQLYDRLHGKAVLLSGRDLLSLARESADCFQRMEQHCEAIIVDDLQFLEGEHAVQRALAAMLDAVSDSVFFIGTISQKGVLIPELYDRLCSHLSLHLSEPDLDIRMRFTLMHMERLGLPEHHPTALTLARRCLRLRHLLGLLERIRLHYEHEGKLPSSAELAGLLEHSGSAVPLTADVVLGNVADMYGCTAAQLCENTRNISLVRPRQIAMYLCRILLGESYPSLGRMFGGRDHSTVMYAVKKIEKLKVTNKDVHSVVTKLTKQCANGVQGGGKAL